MTPLKYSLSNTPPPKDFASFTLMVENKLILFFLKFIFKLLPTVLGKPEFNANDPLKPSKFCFLSMILRIPAVPEASYLAEGDVITSTFSIDSAGSCLSP